ncbi:MAG: flavin reductase [Clostridiales bacterium]|nr:MAG: flavin reductase [Clostridiales bacterium]
MKQIDIASLDENLIKLISKDWMLISAGNKDKWNTMTASWGGTGFIWNMPVTCAVIRPQRYTIEFVEQNNTYSLCFFDESYKKMLGVAGSKSGRDINKMTELGLTPVFEDGTVWFKEASIVLICSKKYIDNIKPENFIDKSIINDFYPQNDFHKAFIGKIEKVYMK